MDSIDTFLPMTLWILATGASILILIVVLSFYAYQKKRFEAGLQDFGDVANLAAQRDLLQARKDELVKWINTQNAEVERLTGERQEQEMLRAELQRLEQECAAKDEGNQALRNEVGELENQRHVLTQTLERLNKEMMSIIRELMPNFFMSGHGKESDPKSNAYATARLDAQLSKDMKCK